MEVAIPPIERGLDCKVKLSEIPGQGDDKPSPDGRLDLGQRHPNLKAIGFLVKHGTQSAPPRRGRQLQPSQEFRPFFSRVAPEAARPAESLKYRASNRDDCAFVSQSVRSVSKSVRPDLPTVSANVRRKWAMIARRADHHCAPLQVPIAQLAPGHNDAESIVEEGSATLVSWATLRSNVT